MLDTLRESLGNLQLNRRKLKRAYAILLILSLVVATYVFWTLRLTGITMAGDASCGIEEHAHTEQCGGEGVCGQLVHTHSIACYSDETADVETAADWQRMFADSRQSSLSENLVAIVQSQVGYRESTLNFQVDDLGVRQGYTRYGAWYGAPYGDWSAMFVSFCLHYAGADSERTPYNIGADAMALSWQKKGLYTSETTYCPVPGDLVFLTNNAVAVVTDVQEQTVTLVQADVNAAVVQRTILLSDTSIIGWGMTAASEQDDSEAILQEIFAAGGTYGLFDADGNLLATMVLDDSSQWSFQTVSGADGKVSAHVPYYFRQTGPPPGENPDEQKYWFFFCEEESCTNVPEVEGILQLSRYDLTIHSPYVADGEYRLPSTGGLGAFYYVMWGCVLFGAVLIYGSIRKRKQEKRGTEQLLFCDKESRCACIPLTKINETE